MQYDYVIVGAGLYGSVFAHEATKRGCKCLVIDSRDHIGGNCYTNNICDINVHVYGPHIFHTSSKIIWDYINQFATFNNFIYRPKVKAPDGKLYSFPINLMTLYQVYGTDTPEDAKQAVLKDIIPAVNDNLEEWAISQIGTKLYELFIRGYTTKQWNISPRLLPSSIIKRLPVRYTYDDNYFNDRYQGIPIGGYTDIFKNMLEGIEVVLSRPFVSRDKDMAKRKVIFTGPIDSYFAHRLGRLEYRSLRFDHTIRRGDVLGNAVINYSNDEPHTRIIEHKHFECPNNPVTVITKEYPVNYTGDNIPYYPIETEQNKRLYNDYKLLADKDSKVVFRGRLGRYVYTDMAPTIASALHDISVEFNEL